MTISRFYQKTKKKKYAQIRLKNNLKSGQVGIALLYSRDGE
jgi:hypothetical protein